MGWPSPAESYLVESNEAYFVVCYNNSITRGNSLWQVENALSASLPVFILQLALIVFFSRLILLVLRPLRQPPVVAEILAGILLGPSGLGMGELFAHKVFPFSSMLGLETLANLSLVYYVFLVGLELDLNPIVGAGSKAISIAITGLVLPIPVGIGLYHLLHDNRSQPKDGDTDGPAHFGPLFWGLALATTNFPELTGILADLKLLHSEVGRTALSAAVITELCSWMLLVIAIAITNKGNLYAVLSTAIFVLICLFLIRPALKWLIRHTSKDNNYNDYHIRFILIGVVACGLITDACGCHSIVGAFMWGVILPKGELKDMIMEKVENFVKSVLIPTFYLVVGIRMNLKAVFHERYWVVVLSVVVFASTAKIASTFLVTLFCNMPPREGLVLGILMNTKGLLALIILSTGRNTKALGNITFSVMLLAYCFMTALIEPVLALTYKSIKNSRRNNCRNIQSLKEDTEFRVLACVYLTRNVSGLINLLGASNPSKQNPICVFVIHLVELAGRASAMLIVHGQSKSSSSSSSRNKTKSQTDHIIIAFDNFETRSNGVSVFSLTAVSPYATMHDDICGLASEKRVNIILIPYHKVSTADGGMDDPNPSIGVVNNNVLDNAPCTVGLFIDRGLTTSIMDSNHVSRDHQRFAMFFIGGSDDREALAYAWKMSRHPSITLTVVRFLSSKEAKEMNMTGLPGEENNNGVLSAIMDFEKETQLDNNYINEFKAEVGSNPSINYLERAVNNGEETLRAISTMEHNYDLYILGRGRGRMSPPIMGLAEWSDCADLGALGDALVTSSFSQNVSVLVMQQGAVAEDENIEQEATGYLREQFGHMTWQPPVKKNSDFVPFVNRRGKGGDEDDSDYY